MSWLKIAAAETSAKGASPAATDGNQPGRANTIVGPALPCRLQPGRAVAGQLLARDRAGSGALGAARAVSGGPGGSIGASRARPMLVVSAYW